MCTLYKGRPYGLAEIKTKDSNDDYDSFDGVGLFTDGELHMGPFTCQTGDGKSISFTHMTNGRPADHSF